MSKLLFCHSKDCLTHSYHRQWIRFSCYQQKYLKSSRCSREEMTLNMQDVFMMDSDEKGQEQVLNLTPVRLNENLGTDINNMQKELDNLKGHLVWAYHVGH